MWHFKSSNTVNYLITSDSVTIFFSGYVTYLKVPLNFSDFSHPLRKNKNKSPNVESTPKTPYIRSEGTLNLRNVFIILGYTSNTIFFFNCFENISKQMNIICKITHFHIFFFLGNYY